MPRKTLIITDVTAMSGDNVCIAGYHDSLTCIRPVFAKGQIKKSHLFQDDKLIIYPSAKVAFEFLSRNPQPPHTEDYIFTEGSIEYKGEAPIREWKEVLRETTHASFEELFPRMESRYVPPDDPGPSIGTIRVQTLPLLRCDYYGNKPSLRMQVTDERGTIKQRIPITDLAFRGLFEHTLQRCQGDCEKAVKSLNRKLDGREIYLRLGLTRPFMKAPVPYSGWCCLQVNGIHTIPDLYNRDYAEWIKLE